MKDSKSVSGFCFKMSAFKVASFKLNFFRRVGTSEAETSVSGEAECLLVIGNDTKSKLFGVISFEEYFGPFVCYVTYLGILWGSTSYTLLSLLSLINSNGWILLFGLHSVYYLNVSIFNE